MANYRILAGRRVCTGCATPDVVTRCGFRDADHVRAVANLFCIGEPPALGDQEELADYFERKFGRFA